MPKQETYYDTLEPVQKGVWNVGRFAFQFALPVGLLDLATNNSLYDLTEEIGLGNLMPNLEQPFENFGLSLLTLHMIANKIDFTEETRKKHSNDFVRFAANTKHIAEKTGLRNLSAASVFLAPETSPEIINAATDLLTTQEHPVLSSIMLAAGVSGVINSLVDIITISGKLVEKWEARYSNHQANVEKSRTRTETVQRDPEIVVLGRKHRQNLHKEVKKVQDHVTGFAEGEGMARANDAAAADPGGYAMQQRLKEHQAMLERDSQNRKLPSQILPSTRLNVESKPLPESLLTSISREAERRFRKMMAIGKFFREQSAKNPQEEKPIVLRSVDRRKK